MIPLVDSQNNPLFLAALGIANLEASRKLRKAVLAEGAARSYATDFEPP